MKSEPIEIEHDPKTMRENRKFLIAAKKRKKDITQNGTLKLKTVKESSIYKIKGLKRKGDVIDVTDKNKKSKHDWIPLHISH